MPVPEPKQSSVAYASPQIAKELEKGFKVSRPAVRVSARESRDVPDFLKELARLQKRAESCNVRFG